MDSIRYGHWSVVLGLIFWLQQPRRSDRKCRRTADRNQSWYDTRTLQRIKPILEEAGYTVTDIGFTGVLEADIALNDGEIDLNVDQHTAYLENFNENTGADLVGITPIPTVPAGLYPGRKDNLAAIEANDTIGIPNDPSNSARALLTPKWRPLTRR